MFLLDTNVISELRKLGDGKADARVTAWISEQDAASFYISALTLMELEIGILRIERRDAAQGERLRSWMDQHVLPEFLERTLRMTPSQTALSTPTQLIVARSYSRTSVSVGRSHSAESARIIGKLRGRRRFSTSEACGCEPMTAARSFWR